jgi:hypothetical protein
MQAKALIGAIEARRDQESGKLLADAQAASQRIIASARTHARERFHAAVLSLRRDCGRRIAQAEARRDTELRLRRHRARSALLAEAWPQLAGALAEIWRNPAGRARWIKAALEIAAARLGSRIWEIEHPAADSEDVRRVLAQMRDMLADVEWTLKPSGDFEAGLRLRVEGAVVDATPAALLALRSRVEAALIAEIERRAADWRGAGESRREAAHG